MVESPHRRAIRGCVLSAACVLAAVSPLMSQTGRFDLLGPKVDVHVTRADRSLPIASVPNLQPGDKLQVHVDLPTTQSVHLLLVVAFLRGTTNPPPDSWFTRVETWKRDVRDEGVTVTVPAEAQQALIFIAPETGGDFATLKSAVRGRPGTFVRASQDLNEASFEQSRIERYVEAIKQVPPGSPAELLDHSHKLAATLQLKPNEDCFKRAADLQAACLSQSGSALLLDDGHGQTMAQMLSTGPTSDLIGAVAGTPVANAGGAGVYSAYVGTVLDVVRLLTGLHTAKYQYIPAIAFPKEDALNLRLNTAPSFHDPKSVIVVALPGIQKAVPPPLQLQDARHVSCLLQPHMVLPLNGAPLVFATGFAHDLTLHLETPGPDGETDLPLVPDAYEGGLVVSDARARKPLSTAEAAPTPEALKAAGGVAAASAASDKPVPPTLPGGPVQIAGEVRGFWGFDSFSGPTVPLQRRPGENWTVQSRGELFAGRVNTVALQSTGTACVAAVSLGSGDAAESLEWHTQDADKTPVIAVKLPLEKAAPGGLNLQVRQFSSGGVPAAVQMVPLRAYADVVRVEELLAHAGDRAAELRGSGLGGVVSARLGNATLTPGPDQPTDEKVLRLVASGGTPLALKPGDNGTAQLTLKDGRTLSVPYHVEEPRPAVTLLSTSFQPSAAPALPVSLNDPHSFPLEGKLTFALRSETPVKFSRGEKVEVALVDGSLSTTLSLGDRTLVLQDARTVLGFLSPAAIFGPSAFGPMQLRVVDGGSTSDWVPLGTLVRTPVVRQIVCGTHAAVAPVKAVAAMLEQPATSGTAATGGNASAAAGEGICTMEGSDLYLVDAVSGAASFAVASTVPEGFAAGSLAVPRPADGHTLFLRLRDDPTHLATVTMEPAKPLRTTARP